MGEFYAEAGFAFDAVAAEKAFRDLIEHPDWGAAWLATSPENAAGYVVFTLGFSMQYGGRDGWVEDVYVRPPFRSHHLGRQLLETLAEHAARDDARAVHLAVAPANADAQSLYELLGWRVQELNLLTRLLPSRANAA